MKVWQQLGLITAGFVVSAVAMADPAGTWRTVDEKTGEARSTVRITNEGGKYVGRVASVIGSPAVCNECKGSFKGKNLIGQTIMWGVKSQGGNAYGGGRIQDPENGSTYNVSLKDNGSTLVVRGYMGISALGRSQTWQRVK